MAITVSAALLKNPLRGCRFLAVFFQKETLEKFLRSSTIRRIHLGYLPLLFHAAKRVSFLRCGRVPWFDPAECRVECRVGPERP